MCPVGVFDGNACVPALYACLFVCLCVCVRACMRACVCLCACLCAYVRACMRACACMCVCLCACLCTRVLPVFIDVRCAVQLDEDLRSWLIEVNTNPYLGVQNPWHGAWCPTQCRASAACCAMCHSNIHCCSSRPPRPASRPFCRAVNPGKR